MTEDEKHHRPIRSFVMRAGRMTVGQSRALDELWPNYGVEYSPAALSLDALFGRHAPRSLEIGFGNGEHLAALAAAHPERDYFGIEVHRPGVGHLLMLAQTRDLRNLRVSDHDAVEVLRDQVPPASLDEVLVLFPDPWHKKRHHKRRLIQPPFLKTVQRVLAPGGRLQVVTDHQGYFEENIEPAVRGSKLSVIDYNRPGSANEGEFVGTNFERKYRREGRPFYAIAATKPV